MNLTQKLLPFAVAALVTTPVMADISGNIGATSNYLWRGVTQTADDAAISGGVDFAAESGLYAGTWVSNVSDGNEMDLYFGYSAEAGQIGYTVGAIYYMYSQADDANFLEVHGDIEVGMFSAGLYYTVDAEADGGEDNIYGYVSVGGDLKDGWSLAGTIGHNEPDEGDDYQHAQLDLGKTVDEFGDFTLTLSQNNIDNDDDPIFAVSWSKSF